MANNNPQLCLSMARRRRWNAARGVHNTHLTRREGQSRGSARLSCGAVQGPARANRIRRSCRWLDGCLWRPQTLWRLAHHNCCCCCFSTEDRSRPKHDEKLQVERQSSIFAASRTIELQRTRSKVRLRTFARTTEAHLRTRISSSSSSNNNTFSKRTNCARKLLN